MAFFGGIMICVALFGLSEYRKLFLENPRNAMSAEVLMQLLFHPASTPAFLCVLLLIVGLCFVAISLYMFCFIMAKVLPWIVGRIWPTFVSYFPLLGGPNVGP